MASSLPDSALVIRCRNIRAGFEEKVILHGFSFDVPASGLLALVGPSGVGKSTLLRTLARYNEQLPFFWTQGQILLGDRDLLTEYELDDAHARVALLAQKARLFTASVLDNAVALIQSDQPRTVLAKRDAALEVLERLELAELLGGRLQDPVTELSIAEQRALGLARLLGGGAQCLLVDEPFRDIDPKEIPWLERTLQLAKAQCPIVMITHNQQRARALADDVLLMVAGRLIEHTSAECFFSAPETELAQEFLRSGNCWPRTTETLVKSRPAPPNRVVASAEPVEPVSPSTDGDHGPSVLPVEATLQQAERPRYLRPGGFHWVLKDRLGGMQRPGLLREEHEDLEALRILGVKYLVSLTEVAYPADKLLPYGIIGMHFPIVDMGAPERLDMLALCERLNRRIDSQLPTVVHCKAGLGRTGTVLACALVHRGAGALRAIHEVRQINPMYIQSEEQLAFIERFDSEHPRQKGL